MKKLFLVATSILLTTVFSSETYAVRLGGRTTIRPHTAAPKTFTPAPRVYRQNPAVRRMNQNNAQSAAPVVPLFIPPIFGTNNLEKLNENLYLVKSDIRRRNDEVSFWTLNNKDNKDSKSAKIQYRIHCATRQFSILAGATYSEAMGKGKELTKGRVNDEAHAIPDGTVMNYLQKRLCARPAASSQKSAPDVKPAVK